MPEKIDFSKVSFLIVDQNKLSTQLIRDILAMLEVTRVRSVTSVARARNVLRGEPVDIIITEYHMEPENGIDLIDWLRTSTDSPDRMIPIIMLTANSEEEYVMRARDRGVTEFLAKPFNVEGLYRRLVSVIARPRAFVNIDNYFGPDRRRRQVEFGGPDRRRND
ncbi:response regulator [Thalassobaculum sp. OXR-137]|uniref:response regulator n=1 Tax=Thalassobaculum sp. OXR-137 TaxID=3100173 RepID=UPI002AC8D5DF|nr:response regulator [Thalassobaculum sp. OXR-137]WPZ35641.1 response regulator [Thalassobaculum sp. OXR-137]